MIDGKKILTVIGKERFCNWARRSIVSKLILNMSGADLSGANLAGANLFRADLSGADMSGANIDYASWPLWCGSQNVKCDERQAKQLMAHALNAARIYWPGGLTEGQISWLNTFDRIQSGEFPKFE